MDKLKSDSLYAVRSSGVSEDGKKASYAGMFDSFLNVKKEEIPFYIQRCVKSRLNQRVRAYRSRFGLHDDARMAVIIQEMVTAEYSGICFTVDPRTNDTSKLLIELGLGLGEDIVSGRVTPMTVAIHKGSGTQDVLSPGEFSNPQLEKLRLILIEVGQSAIAIEANYGRPMDVEWVYSKEEQIVILQARPVTSI